MTTPTEIDDIKHFLDKYAENINNPHTRKRLQTAFDAYMKYTEMKMQMGNGWVDYAQLSTTKKIDNSKLIDFYKRNDLKEDDIDEKIRLLKLYMDVLNVGGCDTKEEELEYLEHAFNQGL